MEINWLAVGMSLIAGVSAGVGALPILMTTKISNKQMDVGLGFSAGLMLVASFFSLLDPSLHIGNDLFGKYFGLFITSSGLFAGYFFIVKSHDLLPHEHFLKAEQGQGSDAFKKVTLIILAIALHNIPEGLAVGVGFGAGEKANGFALALAIIIQNMPEGLVVALGLLSIGQSRQKALWLAFITGMVEPVAALLGFFFVKIFSVILSFALAFAAGTMLFVTCHEMFPEIFKENHESHATIGVIMGICTMVVISTMFS